MDGSRSEGSVQGNFNFGELMEIVLRLLAGIMAFISLGVAAAFVQSRHVGYLLASILYGTCAWFAWTTLSWWPVLIGFGGAWALRRLGLEPGYR